MMPLLALPRGSKERAALEKRVVAGLVGERLPDDHLPIGPVSRKRTYLWSIFRKYFEVTESFERLKLARNFISKLPRRGTLSKIDYIRYHYEFYLNEMYICNLRINLLLDFLIKKCSRAGLVDRCDEVRRIKSTVNRGMKGVLGRRGAHVHERHFKNDKLDQLVSLNSLSSSFDFIRSYRDSEIKAFKKEIVKEITANINELEQFFEKSLYKKIGPLIFSKTFQR